MKKIIANYLERLRDIVLSDELSLWKYCLITSLLFFCTTTAINFLVRAAINLIGIRDDVPTMPGDVSSMDLLILTLIGPLIETTLLSIIVIILSLKITNKNLIGIICAILFALTHKVTLWPTYIIYINMFFLLTIFYIVRSKISYLNGFVAAIIPHSANNLIVVITLLYNG